ncbi:MAG: 2-hydroxyacid dehydrogenase [Paracoccaceae bacterium]
MSRILITRNMPERVVAAAEEAFDEVVLRTKDTPLLTNELRTSLGDFDAVMPTLGDAYSAEVFADIPEPRCKLLANFGVGYNHIDVAAANIAGIRVTNTPGAVTDATADIAMTLMLMSARRAGEGERLVRNGTWTGWAPTQMLGLHLTGKHVGIVGMGRIGQAIAARCHFGFGMQISYFSRSPKDLPFEASAQANLKDLAAAADVMVVAVPGGPATHHLIDETVLSAMKPHAHLINIARGDVIKEAALIDALAAKQIGGAGLDVYEFEPQIPEKLAALENVVLLPHLGTSALEVREAMGLMAIDNLRAFLAAEPLPNLIVP